MRLRARVDANQSEIVSAFRKMGATVFDLSRVGRGCPDLLVGRAGKTYLVEIKDGAKVKSARKLTDAQVTFREVWRGEQPVTVESVDDAVALLNQG